MAGSAIPILRPDRRAHRHRLVWRLRGGQDCRAARPGSQQRSWHGGPTIRQAERRPAGTPSPAASPPAAGLLSCPPPASIGHPDSRLAAPVSSVTGCPAIGWTPYSVIAVVTSSGNGRCRMTVGRLAWLTRASPHAGNVVSPARTGRRSNRGRPSTAAFHEATSPVAWVTGRRGTRPTTTIAGSCLRSHLRRSG